MERATIHLDNGNIIQFEAEEVSIGMKPLSNELTRISWKGIKEGSRYPLWIDVSSVVSVMAEEADD